LVLIAAGSRISREGTEVVPILVAALFSGVVLVVMAISLDADAYRKIPSCATGVSTKGLILSAASAGLCILVRRGSMTKERNVP
jgi:hypothetical protein